MTELTTGARLMRARASTQPKTAPGLTTITEQQVLFSTAAAAGAHPASTRRWTASFATFVAAVRKAAGPPEPLAHRHPARYAYLQHSMMSREMDRL
jgi:hypothetical protein